MKPETVIKILNALSSQVGTETIRAVLGAFAMTDEYKALVADAEAYRRLPMALEGRDFTEEETKAWQAVLDHYFADNAAIDAARAGHE